jgi:hypothetical protein
VPSEIDVLCVTVYGINMSINESAIGMYFLKTNLFCEKYYKTKWQIGTEVSEEIAVSFFRVSVTKNDKYLKKETVISSEK